MPVIPDIQEGEQKIKVSGQSRQSYLETLSQRLANEVWWCMPVIPVIWEGEVGGKR
jgi:hypothetical protein